MTTRDALGTILFASFGLWWVLFPGTVIRFYTWFHRGAARLPRPGAVRLAGLGWLALTLSVAYWGTRSVALREDMPRLPAADSTYSHLDNTFAFTLPDSGGFLVNGQTVAQESVPAHIRALFASRTPEARAVVVWDNPRRRSDAQWLARAAVSAGGRAFDAALSGWPVEFHTGQ